MPSTTNDDSTTTEEQTTTTPSTTFTTEVSTTKKCGKTTLPWTPWTTLGPVPSTTKDDSTTTEEPTTATAVTTTTEDDSPTTTTTEDDSSTTTTTEEEDPPETTTTKEEDPPATTTAEEEDPEPTEEPPPKPSQECYGLDGDKYVTRDTLKDIIEDQFCPDAVDQGTLDEGSGALFRIYLEGTVEEVGIAIEWEPGLDFKPNTDDCVRYLKDMILDGCDGSDDNPMNWKGGGKVTVGDVKYRIDPRAPRQPAPDEPWGGCDTTYKAAFDDVWIWGSGWANSDFGDRLKKELKGCALLPDTFKFEYGLGDDGREWSVWAHVGVFQNSCVGHACHTAGAPDGFDCSGSG